MRRPISRPVYVQIICIAQSPGLVLSKQCMSTDYQVNKIAKDDLRRKGVLYIHIKTAFFSSKKKKSETKYKLWQVGNKRDTILVFVFLLIFTRAADSVLEKSWIPILFFPTGRISIQNRSKSYVAIERGFFFNTFVSIIFYPFTLRETIRTEIESGSRYLKDLM